MAALAENQCDQCGGIKGTCEWCEDPEQDERDALAVLDRNIKKIFGWILFGCMAALGALTAALLWWVR